MNALTSTPSLNLPKINTHTHRQALLFWQEVSMYFQIETCSGKQRDCVQCRNRYRLLKRLMRWKANILVLSITLTFWQIPQCLPVWSNWLSLWVSFKASHLCGPYLIALKNLGPKASMPFVSQNMLPSSPVVITPQRQKQFKCTGAAALRVTR